MKTFKINRRITIECEYYQTRYSWGHKAYLYLDGRQVDYKKITYYNRTWESYEFQSIMEVIVEDTKALTKRQKTICNKFIHNGGRVEDDLRPLKTIGLIAKMGEFFADTQEKKNDWKERILKAGLEDKGLIMPEDWDTLTEDEKEKRLNGAISAIA